MGQLEVIVVTLCTCLLTNAAVVYEASGVLQPETRSRGSNDRVISSVVEILPEISSVLDQISANSRQSSQSDPDNLRNIINSIIPISKRVLVASAKAEGREVRQDEVQALNAAEAIMPAVFDFMDTLRNTAGTSTQFQSPQFRSRVTSYPGGSGSNYNNVATDATRLGQYENIVTSTVNILPDISKVFQQISTDPGQSNPNDPQFLQRVIMSFMPISRKVLFENAKAEGRAVRQDELERLNAIEAAMPSVMNFMETLRQNNFNVDNSPSSRTSSFSSYPAASYKYQEIDTMPQNTYPAVPPTMQQTNLNSHSILLPTLVRSYAPVVPSSIGYAYSVEHDSAESWEED